MKGFTSFLSNGSLRSLFNSLTYDTRIRVPGIHLRIFNFYFNILIYQVSCKAPRTRINARLFCFEGESSDENHIYEDSGLT